MTHFCVKIQMKYIYLPNINRDREQHKYIFTTGWHARHNRNAFGLRSFSFHHWHLRSILFRSMKTSKWDRWPPPPLNNGTRSKIESSTGITGFDCLFWKAPMFLCKLFPWRSCYVKEWYSSFQNSRASDMFLPPHIPSSMACIKYIDFNSTFL